MRAFVFAHVDEFRCFLNSAEGSFHRRFRTACERNNGAVRACTGVHVKQRDSFHRFNCCGDLANDIQVAALGEIGHAFDESLHKIRR